MNSEAKGQRFVALCMLGFLLFNYPILALFNVPGTLLGVPVLYAYIFIAWALLIASMALMASKDGCRGACCTAPSSSSRRSPTWGCCSHPGGNLHSAAV